MIQQNLCTCCLQVVVATPGRLWELMRDRQPHLTDLSHLSFLVLDEADRMVQQGHFQVRRREGGSGETRAGGMREDEGRGLRLEGLKFKCGQMIGYVRFVYCSSHMRVLMPLPAWCL